MRNFRSVLVFLLFASRVAYSNETPEPLASGQQKFGSLGVCHLTGGQEITDCRLGYRTWGNLNLQRSNAVLFPTWFSGTSKDIQALAGF